MTLYVYPQLKLLAGAGWEWELDLYKANSNESQNLVNDRKPESSPLMRLKSYCED